MDFTYNACDGIGRVERALLDGALVQRYDRRQDDWTTGKVVNGLRPVTACLMTRAGGNWLKYGHLKNLERKVERAPVPPDTSNVVEQHCYSWSRSRDKVAFLSAT